MANTPAPRANQRPANQPNRYDPKPPINTLAVVTDRAVALQADADARMLLFRQTHMGELTDLEFELMTMEAAALGLDVLRKEYAAIKFGGKYTGFPTIHGLLKMAQRSNKFDGMETQWCGPDGIFRDVWLEVTPPAAARCKVYVVGRSRPFVGIATFQERKRTYKAKDRDGHYTGAEILMDQWKTQPAHMLGKCARADALRASGIIAELGAHVPDAAFGSSAFLSDVDDVDPMEAIPETTGDPRVTALRYAHHEAAAHGGHALVRATVQAIDPEIASLKQADAAVLNQAGEVIGTFAERAPAVAGADPDQGAVVDGEIVGPPTEAEVWRDRIREVIRSEPNSQIATLANEAGTDVDRWVILITTLEHWPAVDRFYQLGMKALKADAAGKESLVDALAKREDLERARSATAIHATAQHGLPGVAAASPK